MTRRRQILSLIAGLSLAASMFQSCAPSHREWASMDLAQSHPDTDPTETQESRPLLADKIYLESVFREVFLSPQSTQGEIDALNYYMAIEINSNQHLFGRPCNPYETADFCGGSLNHASVALAARSSSGREAARVKICRWIISNDTLLTRARDKVKGNDPTPNSDSVRGIVRLFYPSMRDAILAGAAEALMALDTEMNHANEKVMDRWRLIFLTVCESPGWEIL